MKPPAVLALVGITVVSLAAGALGSNLLASSDDEQALPAVGTVAPVLGPLDGEPGPAAPDSPAPIPGEGEGGGSGSGSGGGGAAPVSDPEGLVEPYLGGGSGGSAVLPAAVRSVDPCADGPPCDDPGVGSTVLGIFAAPPPEITNVFNGIAECHLAPDDPYVLGTPYQIVSTFPGQFVITLTNRRTPGEVRTGRASTLASEIAREERAGMLGDRSAGHGYRTCGGITLPNRTTDWDVQVEGTSASGQTASWSGRFLQEGAGGRPPVQIETPRAPFEHQLRVVAPASSRGGVVVSYVPAAGATGAACRSREAALFAATAASPFADSVPVPPEELAAAGYPYDQAFDRRAKDEYQFCVGYVFRQLHVHPYC